MRISFFIALLFACLQSHAQSDSLEYTRPVKVRDKKVIEDEIYGSAKEIGVNDNISKDLLKIKNKSAAQISSGSFLMVLGGAGIGLAYYFKNQPISRNFFSPSKNSFAYLKQPYKSYMEAEAARSRAVLISGACSGVSIITGVILLGSGINQLNIKLNAAFSPTGASLIYSFK